MWGGGGGRGGANKGCSSPFSYISLISLTCNVCNCITHIWKRSFLEDLLAYHNRNHFFLFSSHQEQHMSFQTPIILFQCNAKQLNLTILVEKNSHRIHETALRTCHTKSMHALREREREMQSLILYLAASPTQTVETSGRICLIVSNTAIP